MSVRSVLRRPDAAHCARFEVSPATTTMPWRPNPPFATCARQGSLGPREPPCSLARSLPPVPAPAWPGEAGAGEAFSHGDFPVALPGITRTSVADTTAWVGARVVVVDALVGGGALADGFPLELPHPATTSAPRQAAAAIFGTLTREFMCS